MAHRKLKHDLKGKRFGRYDVIARAFDGKKGTRWFCKCSCGNTSIVSSSDLMRGTCTKCRSCGNMRHGQTDSPEHKIWRAMLGRCKNQRDKRYAAYGGRGVSVCDRWHRFENFIADVGTRPSKQHVLDRKDNDGNYEPGNVRWATLIESARNTRSNRMLTLGGVTLTMVEWSERLGMRYGTLVKRLNFHKWSAERALTEPVRKLVK